MDIFDKIIAGEIPAYKVFEDDNVIAFLDISQVTPGHTLLVPKRHIENIFDYDEATAQTILSYLPRLARAIKASDSSITGLNIISNNGVSAGQSVMHNHWHLIPRRDGDDFFLPNNDHSDQYDEQTYQAIADQIIRELH